VPAECDVSIRPGWFHHPKEDGAVKTLEQLVEIWHASVGRGAGLLLNLPVDRRGLVPEADAARLRELRAALDEAYRVDLLAGGRASATSVRGGDARFAAARVLGGGDGPPGYWATDDGVTAAAVAVELARPVTVDRVLAGERIELGQRVRAFAVEARVEGAWRTVAEGTTIGRKRIVRFPGVRADAVRLAVRDARACLAIARLSAYGPGR
jgi:alpha-L-fucosidase